MKKHTVGSIFFICLIDLLILLVVLFALTISKGDRAKESQGITKIDFCGYYSSDGNDKTQIDSFEDFEYNKEKEVVFTGRFSENIPDDKFLIMPISDAWVEVAANGKTIDSNYTEQGKLTNTPGISYIYISGNEIPDNTDITITFTNPYTKLFSINPVESTLSSIGYGEMNAPYVELLHNHSVSIAISLAICFLGLFAFTLAGLLWKNILFRNLTLAFLAVVGGIYVLTDNVCMYLPLWIDNPVLCLIVDEFTIFMLPIATFLYMRQYVESKNTKTYLNILTAGSLLLGMVAYLFQIFGFMDILLSQYYLMLFIDLGIIGTVVVLAYEAFYLKSKSVRNLLITMTPLIFTSCFDALNAWIAFAPGKSTMRLGLLITIASQLYFLIVETIKHNKEVAKYQQMQHELLQMRISIMVSQIQPHFLYNSLTSIAQLCEKNPSQAKKATIEFADYMRHNMNSLKEEKPVPFASELNHLKTYLSLEKMRFGDDLNIVYNIETTDFSIPSLAVQPLVENAVKHGVGMKEDGGTVTIATKEAEDHFEIIVTDDGVGFDVTAPKNDGRTHVGMENVKNRLKTMCNATVETESTPGIGTTVKILIPKEVKE